MQLCCVECKHQQLAGRDAAGEPGVLPVGTLRCVRAAQDSQGQIQQLRWCFWSGAVQAPVSRLGSGEAAICTTQGPWAEHRDPFSRDRCGAQGRLISTRPQKGC